MSDLRPSGMELDGAAQLLASARMRVSAAATDLAIPAALRLTERQRATLATLLPKLLRTIEDELRSMIAEAFDDETLRAALSSARLDIAGPILAKSGAAEDPLLVTALLRRAEEHRLHRGGGGGGGGDNALLIDLAGDSDSIVAGEAMALLIAQSGRFDPFHEPILIRSDLSAELEHQLVWTVAAALRRYIVGQHGVEPGQADEVLASAGRGLLAAYDEGDTLDSHSLRLARALRDAGKLDDMVAARALSESGLSLFLAILSVRTGLDCSAVWEIMSARDGRGMAFLLRAAGVAREPAGAILFALTRDEVALVPQLDTYDGSSQAQAQSLLALWRADAGYRDAVARLS
ncbi:DUF2336 domain-containing protein [Sphingosinicella sp. BN140058]|uniref:DUF2336 domain-containing protein n=1 Tax=Sphingosinicella sp. BN140058 TaxID=1892855 RepID=UPI0010104592|nr:DUF2336 domain-containing protein [Sphingosinicella sp. BN140058]QAY79022.1 DUF2336 domain-containing protein [Sphingosinicella sp. BN140058]